MGPIILLDKSTFHALSPTDLKSLYKHYYVNVCPILLIEILCDLYDKKDFSKIQFDKVKLLASKINQINSVVNVNHRQLIIESLLGNHAQMTNRPIVGNSRIVTNNSGQKGIVFLPSQESFDLLRWEEGDFTDEEIETAKIWKTNYSNSNFNLNDFITQFRKYNKNEIIRFDNLNQVQQFVDVKANDPEMQYVNLQHFIHTQGLDLEIINKVNNRWIESSSTNFSVFSPYSFYCYKVDLFFRISMVSELIGAKATNIIDLQYLYYLPFCQVFSSGDNVHSILVPYLLEKHQTFVDSNELKTDLKALSLWWSELSHDEREAWDSKYGNRPPSNSDSITSQLWEKYMGSWSPVEGNRVYDMTEDEKQAVVKRLNELFKSAL